MTYTVSHVTVKDNPPPQQRMVIGVYRDISPRREVEEDSDLIHLRDDEDEAEVKVVAPRRGRRPKANEAAETK